MNDYNKDLLISFDAPLNKLDSSEQTFGCRQFKPDICKNCFVENICAFVTKDNICKKPSLKWKKRYYELAYKEKTKDENSKII